MFPSQSRPPGTSRAPRVSVILCTYNPARKLLDWAIDSVGKQTVAPTLFEFVVVDNNSSPPVRVVRPDTLPVRVLREPKQGLVHARVCGIRATRAPLIVFLDDDNHLAPDYLARAIEIAGDNPSIGCFGGKAEGVLEIAVPEWKQSLLGYVGVRDYGSHPITSTKDEWGEWEPIGAGMVCRRDVAEAFVEFVESHSAAARLGRSGSNLMSGEDSLIAHAAYRLGYSCSYQPALRLSHWMKHRRLRFLMLARTVAAHGRSQAVLQAIKGRTVRKLPVAAIVQRLALRYYEHVRNSGFGAGTVKWCWELGYLSESRRIGS